MLDPTIGNQPPRLAIPLAAAEDGGEFTLIRDFTGLRPGTRMLILVPLAPLHEDRAALAAVAEPAHGG